MKIVDPAVLCEVVERTQTLSGIMTDARVVADAIAEAVIVGGASVAQGGRAGPSVWSR